VNNEMPSLTASQTDSSKVFFKDLTGKCCLFFSTPIAITVSAKAIDLRTQGYLEGYECISFSSDKMPAVAKFAIEYNLVEPNIHFGRAEGMEVYRAVGPIQTVPTFFIYNNQELVARMEGEISLPKLEQMMK